MNYSEIKFCDIANGAGVRTTLFVSGCRHHCFNCFNPGTWAFEAGEPFTREVEDKILESLEPSYIDGLTLLGGEPFEPENQETLIALLERVRSERPQSAPYRPLAKVMETDQTLFTHKDIRDTVVGLYCPVYMNQVNTPGWHLHFVSEDRTQGGHVLDLSVTQAELSLDDTGGFAMLLPDNPMFRNFDFSVEQAEDVRKVEQGQ